MIGNVVDCGVDTLKVGEPYVWHESVCNGRRSPRTWHIDGTRRRPGVSAVICLPALTSHDGPPTSVDVRLCLPSKLVMRVRSPSPALVR